MDIGELRDQLDISEDEFNYAHDGPVIYIQNPAVL